ncbi:YnaM/YnfT family protein [Scandinavium sp.]
MTSLILTTAIAAFIGLMLLSLVQVWIGTSNNPDKQ